MDKFIVSARKYRPQAFDTVVGQAHITTTLKMPLSKINWHMLFCFVVLEVWAKLPVLEF